MFSLVRWTLMPAVVLGLLLVSGPAGAAGIKDEAHFFKPETVRKADAIIREIDEKIQARARDRDFPDASGRRPQGRRS